MQDQNIKSQQTAFALIRILFGVVWLLNAWFQASSAYQGQLLANFSANESGQSFWVHDYMHWILQGMQSIADPSATIIMVILDVFIGVSLVLGVWGRFFGWVGLVYSAFLWTSFEGFGGPYGSGATDPGPGIIYAIVFGFLLATSAWDKLSLSPIASSSATSGAAFGSGLVAPWKQPLAFDLDRMTAVRIIFGLVWTFDAFWKWHPYFLNHLVTVITQGDHSDPGWLLVYVNFVIAIIRGIGPEVVAVVIALLETSIAVSLLTGQWLRLFVPVGLVFSMGIWFTAEGLGGPYTATSTGMPDDIVGNAIIYVFAFAILYVANYRFHAKTQTIQGRPVATV